MKPSPKLFATIWMLTLTLLLFISCSKNDPVINYNILPPPTPPIHDSLSGREFIFNDLTWGSWGNQVVVIEVPNSHLFLNKPIEVYIDSSFSWKYVPFYTVEFGFGTPIPFPPNNGFIHDNEYFNSLFLFAIGANKNQLLGTKVSVKVKVL